MHDSGDPPPPRQAPERALPPYAWRPGLPHPTRDPRGHSFGVHSDVDGEELGDWRASSALGFGCDLYNHGYFWEAHEAWEPLWRALPRGSPERHLLQGLIQLAAAAWKERLGRHAAAARIGARARRHLRRAGSLPNELFVGLPGAGTGIGRALVLRGT